jgi:hypothetical protein
MEHEMRKHIDKFNKFRLSENLNISDVSGSKKLSIDDMRTYSPWDKIYNHYTRECLNSDGDFSMSFIDWLKINYPDGSPR